MSPMIKRLRADNRKERKIGRNLVGLSITYVLAHSIVALFVK